MTSGQIGGAGREWTTISWASSGSFIAIMALVQSQLPFPAHCISPRPIIIWTFKFLDAIAAIFLIFLIGIIQISGTSPYSLILQLNLIYFHFQLLFD